MCIRAQFTNAMVAFLIEETYIGPEDREALAAVLDGCLESTFAHPLALTRLLTKRGFIYDDKEDFSMVAKAIGPMVRDYVRFRKRQGDVFAGTPWAQEPLAKPITAGKVRMPRKLTLARKYRRPRTTRPAPARRQMVEAFCAVAAAANSGIPRNLGPNVVDLVAYRGRAS